MAHIKKKNTTFSNLTQNRIASAKGLLLLCTILALVLDCAVLVMLIFNTSEVKFIVIPALLILLDFLFLFKAIFSNYRFSYAIKGVWLHIISVILVCAYMIVSAELLSGGTVFTTFALYAMPAVHLIWCLTALINALHAANRGKIGQSVFAILMTAVFAAGSLIYGFFIFQNGFFGQSSKRTERTVVYSFDEAKGYYVAVDLLKGFGNTVTIPETFNGERVGGIDCKIFSDPKLTYAVLDCATDVEFLNIGDLEGLSSKLSCETTKEKLDGFRGALYSLAETNTAFLALANHITPYDMEEDQVYLVFRYDAASLKLANHEILPTWFGKKDTKFDIYSHGANVNYIGHSDPVDVADLYWCQQNQDSMIFNSVSNLQGTKFNVATVSGSLELDVRFEKIYQINIGDDNDTKYQIDTVYTSIHTEDGEKPYKLATADRVMTVLEQIPLRNGFDRSFMIGSDRHELSDMAQELSIMDQAGMKSLDVYPHWVLRAPTIDTIAADGKTKDHSAVYGSNVLLTADVTAPHETISVKYEWSKSGLLSENPNHTIQNLHPTDAGEYTLTVTAYADFTSLTSSAVKTVNVGFEKKVLHYSWIAPADTVYSASEKQLYANHTRADIINGDTITQEEKLWLAVTGSEQPVTEVLRAGNYRATVSLTGDAATKYRIASGESEYKFSIEPYPVYVQWETDTRFEYDGTEKKPGASAMGIGEDGLIKLQISGTPTDGSGESGAKTVNVGNYVAKATTANTNYVLFDTESVYIINPKPISFVDWQDIVSFVYNSEIQHPKVESLSGVIEDDMTAVLEGIVYDGTQVNAGFGYTITMQLADSFPSLNYTLKCETTETFDITPKPLTLTVNQVTTPYTGAVIDPSLFRFTAHGVAENDKIEEIVALVYKTYIGGVETPAVNVTPDAYVVGGSPIPLEKYTNYDITVEQGSLTIQPQKLTVTLHDKGKVYDGLPYQGDYTFDYKGLISTYDAFEEVIRGLDFVSITDSDANTYEIDALVTEDGQGAKYGNYTVEIVKAKLKIDRAPLTVTAVGTTKVYDGYTFGTDGFSIAVDRPLYGGKTPADLGTPSFGGQAITEKNAGEYALSVKMIPNDVNRNYDITYENGTAVITPKPITVTALDLSKIYNGQTGGNFDFEIVEEQLADGDTKSSIGKVTYGGTAVTAKDAGVYTITVTALGTQNYIIGQLNPGTLTINKREIIVTAVANAKTYDGIVGGDFRVSVTGLVNGEGVSVLGTPGFSGDAVAAKNAGLYTLNVQYADEIKNYTVAQYNAGTFIIMKAKVKINIDSASLTKVYDGQSVDPDTIRYTVEGLRGDDSVQMLGMPQYSGSLFDSSLGAAGIYTLTVTLLGGENYEETSATVGYTITPKEITVTAVATDRVYDGTAGGNFSITVDGLINGDDASVLGTPVFYGDAVTAIHAGTYTLRVQFSGSTGNYKVTETKSASFTITPKEVTVTAVAVSRPYAEGQVGGEFSFKIEGLVSGSESDFTCEFSGSAVSATEKGTYELKVEITPKDQTNNYRFQYVDADFTIS